MDPTWQHPFTSVIAGPTGCGKSHFVGKFLKNITSMCTPAPNEVIWCYGEWQTAYKQLEQELGGTTKLIFNEGLIDTESWTTDKSRLVIIDDLMSETDDRVTKLFTKGSHHRNMSIMYLVQNMFGKNKEQRTISLNTHYLVVFKNPRDMSQITNLGKQMYPGRLKYLQESYKDATTEAHGYLLLDLRQNTPDHLRLRTHIFPDQLQTVYLEK